jgi:glycosyltransferase involved in cell wall biosynthesis
MENPKISILVNCYNGEKYLSEALDSIYAQTYQNFEIVFVNNCSTDNSLQIAKNYDERLKVVTTPKVIPLYSARNYGLKSISGDYLCFLDTDDLWHPKKLEKQVDVAKQKFGYHFICSAYKCKFEKASMLKKMIYRTYEIFKFCSVPNGQVGIDYIINNYIINIQTVMIKWQEVSDECFFEELNLVGDYEFFLRIIKKYNLKVYFLQDKLVTSRLHPSQLSTSSAKKWIEEISQVRDISFKKLFNDSEIQKFQREIDLWIFKKHLADNEFKSAFKLISKYKFKDLMHFYQYLKSLFLLLKSKVM